jgi:Flp pilus assembly protein TadB
VGTKPATSRLPSTKERMMAEKHTPTIKTKTKAQAGVTGHNVRYVLAFGLAGVIIAFLLIGLYFYDVQF